MRIVAGTARGRALAGPKSDEVIRPTADRVRQATFDVLGQWVDGLVVLDLFAGTGAFGLEALSRGAATAVLVDSGREALALCRGNAQSLGFAQQVEVLALGWGRALDTLAAQGRRFDLVFSDPPYALEAGEAVLQALVTRGVLAPGATVVLEHSQHEGLPERVGPLARIDTRDFGQTTVSIFRLTAPAG